MINKYDAKCYAGLEVVVVVVVVNKLYLKA